MKLTLEKIKNVCQVEFNKVIEFDKRVDNSDYLALSFSILNDNNFKGGLSIVFNDISGFEIVLLKSLDKGNRRYFKRIVLFENLNIKMLVNDIHKIIMLAIEKYQKIKIEDLLVSEFVIIE